MIEGLYRAPGKAPVVPPRAVFRDEQTLFTVDEVWEPAGDNATWKRHLSESTAVVRGQALAFIVHAERS